MGLPSTLSGKEEETQTGSVSVVETDFGNPCAPQLMCFLFAVHAAGSPGPEGSPGTEGSRGCHRAAAAAVRDKAVSLPERPAVPRSIVQR